jgi:plastocyanin
MSHNLRRASRFVLLAVLAVVVLPWFGLLALSATGAEAAVAHRHATAQQASAKPKDVTVDMSLTGGFSPSSIQIHTGTTVVWHNSDSVDYPGVGGHHQVVAEDGSFASPQVAPGSSWASTFLKPGTFPYHCANHPEMTGTVKVTGPPISKAAASKNQTIDIVEPDPNNKNTWGFKPSDVTVETGTTVTWRNTGAMEHTVTSDDKVFDSGHLKSGQSFSFTFRKPGVYGYHCSPHPWMKGTVRVAAPGHAPPKDRSPGGSSSSPSSGQPPPPPPASSSGGGGGPTTYHVNIVEGSSSNNWGFDPSTVQIGVGDTVAWKNTGTIQHSVTATDGSFDSGLIAPGATFQHTFTQTGTFKYHCRPHPWMTGTVVVSKTAPAASSGSMPSMGSAHTHSSAARPSPAADTSTLGRSSNPEVATATVPRLSSSIDERLLAILVVGAVAASCAAFLVGRWWNQLIPARSREDHAA